jgi:cytochrome c oxidase cbb3-type subunit III
VRAVLCAALVPLVLAACEREQRSLRTPPPVAAALDYVALMPNGIGGAPPPVLTALGHPYESNAYQLNQGKRLFTWFNCKGCHADGGGNTGPALMDGWWRYGPDPASIFATIRNGRPNGMPAFGDKMTTDEIWQLVGYAHRAIEAGAKQVNIYDITGGTETILKTDAHLRREMGH